MLFLDDIKNITKECELYKYIVKTGQNLEKSIEVQYAKKRTLTQILDEIANIKVDEVNLDNTKNLLSMIEEIKNVLDRINDNIDGARRLESEVNNIIVRIDSVISNKINDELLGKDINYFYMLYIEKVNITEDTNLAYESIILKACEYIFSVISGNNEKENFSESSINSIYRENNNEEYDDKVKEEAQKDKEEIHTKKINSNEEKNNLITAEEMQKDNATKLREEKIQNDSDKKKIQELKESADSQILKEVNIEKNNVKERVELNKNKIKKNNKDKKVKKLRDNNTLKISEAQNKVFLPYKIFELEDILKANPDEYDSMEDVIKEEYIIPLGKYKNAAFSRFKEAYNLMRVKEKSSFSEALNLAFEVTFKNDLNPAVITACKDLHELDVYLDCLEKKDLDKFVFFNIEYEVLPSIKTDGRRIENTNK